MLDWEATSKSFWFLVFGGTYQKKLFRSKIIVFLYTKSADRPIFNSPLDRAEHAINEFYCVYGFLKAS